MFESMNEQFQNAIKPVNDMLASNAKVMEQLAQQQIKFFSEMINDSVAYTEALSAQKDISGIFEAQKSYVESVQGKIIFASREAHEVMTRAQDEACETVKECFTADKPAAARSTTGSAGKTAAK